MTILLTRSATVYHVEGPSMFNEAALARATGAGQGSGFLERIQQAVIRPWHRESTTGADSGQTARSAASFDSIALRELVDGNPIR